MWNVHCGVRGLSLCACVSAVLCLSARAVAEPPSATVKLEVDGAPIGVVPTVSENLLGLINYAMTAQSENEWSASATVSADPDTVGGAQISGIMSFTNKSKRLVNVVFEFDLPLCPVAIDACTIGGLTTVKLTMDDDGGQLVCPQEDALWSARIDRSTSQDLFPGPFNMSGTGKGTATTTATFGVPIPAMNYESGANNFGMRHRFTLTPGETVKFVSLYNVAATAEQLVECSAADSDINDDGIVDAADLGLLLAAWGSNEAGADITQDGSVNGDDLGQLLSKWAESE